MKRYSLIILFLISSQFAFSQIKELGISKFFADTSTINIAAPDSGQFVRIYPLRFVQDTVGKLLKVDDTFYDTLAMLVESLPDCVLEIGAHTESKGPDKQNITISQHKAANLKGYLVKICNEPGERLEAKGYGEKQLLNRCDDNIPCTESESLLNRRIEIRIVAIIKKQN